MYYAIVRYTGITELVLYILLFMFQRLHTFREFVHFYCNLYTKYPILKHSIWIMYASLHVVNIPIILAGVQRLFLLSNPFKGNIKFQRIVPILFIILPFLSLFLSMFIPLMNPRMDFDGTRLVWGLDNSRLSLAIASLYSIIYFIGNTFVNVLTLIYLRKYQNRVTSIRRMVIISLFIGIIQTIYFIYLVAFAISVLLDLKLNALFEDVIFPFIVDLTCLPTPWIHLFFNKLIRKNFFRQMRFWNNTSTLAYSVAKL